MIYKINYSIGAYTNDITVEVRSSNKVKIPDETFNKALIVAMNYLLDNMETTEQESAE